MNIQTVFIKKNQKVTVQVHYPGHTPWLSGPCVWDSKLVVVSVR